MILYLKKVQELLRKFVLVQVKHIPRAENSLADALEKLGTAFQEDLSRLTPVEHLAEPSIDLYDEEVSPVMSEPSWIDPIWDYLIEGLLPNDPKEASKLRTRSAGLLFIEEAFINEVFSHPSSSASQGKTPITY